MSVFSSILSVIMAVPSIIGKVIAGAAGYLKVILPILTALRPALPKLDEGLDKLEDLLRIAGDASGAYLQENVDAIRAVEIWSGRGVAVMQEINILAIELRISACERTPGTITATEAESIGVKIDRLRALMAQWGEDTEKAEALVAKA